MQITLFIDGKEKTFTNDFVKARVFRNALKLNQQLKGNGDISVELFDTMVEFVAIAFNNQFSVDDVWDGIEAHRLQGEIMRVFNEVLNFGGLAVEGDQGNDQGK